jgi:hypothetical protein
MTNTDEAATVNISALPDVIPFDQADTAIGVILAKIKEAEYLPMLIGEIADKTEPKYGDSTMEKLAEKRGMKLSTLNHYRTVYRAWKDILPPGAKFPFAVLRELAAVPNRAELLMAEPNMSKRRAEAVRVLKDHKEIIAAYPDLTCSNKAREIRSKYDEGDATWRTEPTEQTDDDADDDVGETNTASSATAGSDNAPEEPPAKARGARRGPMDEREAQINENERLLRHHLKLANEMNGAAETRKNPLSAEQREYLSTAALWVPETLETMEKAGEDWLEYVAWLKELAAEKEKEIEARNDHKPIRASAPAEPAQAAV